PPAPRDLRRASRPALATAIVVLVTVIPPSVASAQFDFTLSTLGPQNVVQGHSVYFVLTGTTMSGTSPNLIPITVTGLPAGATVSFPDIVRSCCGTNQIFSFNFSTTIPVSTLASTPVGPATLTVTVTAGTVSHSVSYPITVTAPPNALSRQSYAPIIPVPQKALWESNMTTLGSTFCAQLVNPSLTADQKLAATYYDSERVFYNI